MLENIQRLIECGRGDKGRLEYMMRRVQDGLPLYNSDRKYLDRIVGAGELSANDMVNIDSDEERHEEQSHVQHTDTVEYAKSQAIGLDEKIRESSMRLNDQKRMLDDLDRKRQNLEQIVKELHDAETKVSTAKDTLEELTRYKARIEDVLKVQNGINADIDKEKFEIQQMLETQMANVEEQSTALESIRVQRSRLETESAKVAEVVAEVAIEKDKLAKARAANRKLIAEEKKLIKNQKDMEKLERDIQKNREKISKKTEDEKIKIKQLSTLKQELDKAMTVLEDAKGRKEALKKETKLAQKVLTDSRNIQKRNKSTKS